MNEDTARRFDVTLLRAVESCAGRCADDLLHALAAHPFAATLAARRQALIERTTSALLRIIADESQRASEPDQE